MWKLLLLPVSMAFMAPALADLQIKAPSRACSMLADQGLKGRKWTEYADGVSGCASNYKEIGEGVPQPNNLAFYVTGEGETVRKVKLVLNYNQPRSEAASKASTRALATASQKLAIRSLGTTLPKPVLTAIERGRSIKASLGSGEVEVIRDDWPSGKGYEVHVIME